MPRCLSFIIQEAHSLAYITTHLGMYRHNRCEPSLREVDFSLTSLTFLDTQPDVHWETRRPFSPSPFLPMCAKRRRPSRWVCSGFFLSWDPQNNPQEGMGCRRITD